jgi:predicted MFS family arabinose efflux permease
MSFILAHVTAADTAQLLTAFALGVAVGAVIVLGYVRRPQR